MRVVVLSLPLIVNGSVSTSFETIRNTLYKAQSLKTLHSVFRVSYFFFIFFEYYTMDFRKKQVFFFDKWKKFSTARKTGLFSKKILPLIVNGSGCVLLPLRYRLPLIVNGSGCVLLAFRCGLPLIVNGSGCALLPFRYRLPLIVNGSGCVLLPFRCGLPLIVNGSGMCASALPVRTFVNR